MNFLTNVVPELFNYFTHLGTPGALQTPAGIGRDICLHFKVISILQNRITCLEKTLETFEEGVSQISSLIFSPIFFSGKFATFLAVTDS